MTLDSKDKYLKGLENKTRIGGHEIDVPYIPMPDGKFIDTLRDQFAASIGRVYSSVEPNYMLTGIPQPVEEKPALLVPTGISGSSKVLEFEVKVPHYYTEEEYVIDIKLEPLPEEGIVVPNIPYTKIPPPFGSSLDSLYISGPMRGIPKLNHEMFMDVTTKLRTLGYTVYNPAELDPSDDESIDNEEYKKRLKKALSLMLQAKHLVLLPGWEKSDGCLVELNCARAVGMKILFIEELLK